MHYLRHIEVTSYVDGTIVLSTGHQLRVVDGESGPELNDCDWSALVTDPNVSLSRDEQDTLYLYLTSPEVVQ